MAGTDAAIAEDGQTANVERVKANLTMMDRVGLIALIHDLYEVDALNRRVLHARFAPKGTTIDQYRRLVRAAVFPDPLSRPWCVGAARSRTAVPTQVLVSQFAA